MRLPVTAGTTSKDITMTLPTVLSAATVVSATNSGSRYSRNRTGRPAAAATAGVIGGKDQFLVEKTNHQDDAPG